MGERWYERLWDVVKPPPAAGSPAGTPTPAELKQRQRQRRLVTTTLIVAVVLVCGWGVYSYNSSAHDRAMNEYKAGMKLMSPGSYPKAIGRFDSAISIWPELAEAYAERGIAEQYLNDTGSAIGDFEKALEIKPDLTIALNGLGLTYIEKHDAQRALDVFRKSVAAEPTVDGYFQLGQIYESRGDHQKAIENYDRAISEMPNAPFVYRARALAKNNLGDAEGAAADRKRAVELEVR